MFITIYMQNEFAHFLHFLMKKHWKKVKKLSNRVISKAVHEYIASVVRLEMNSYYKNKT